MPAGLLYQSTFLEVTLRYINFLSGLNVVELHVSPRDLISSSNFLKIPSIPFLTPKPGILAAKLIIAVLLIVFITPVIAVDRLSPRRMATAINLSRAAR